MATNSYGLARARGLTLALVLLIGLGTPALPAAADEPAPADLIVNGGFEDVTGLGFNKQGVSSVGPGASLPGWRVTNGSVDVARSLQRGPGASSGPFNPQAGSYSLDLNGQNPGTVGQTVPVRSGEGYELSLYLAVDPGCSTPRASVEVGWDGTTVTTFTVDQGGDRVAPGWTRFTVEVTAAASTGTLQLTSGVGGSCGPIVDSVRLVEVLPPPPVPTALVDVSLSAGSATTAPGAGDVPVGDVPLDQVSAASLSLIAAAPLRSVPLRSVPLRSVPLRSVPLRSVPLRSVPLRSVTLNQIPLVGDLTWADVLAGTALVDRPLQEITFDEVLALPSDADGRLAEVSLDSVDVSSSPLRNISLSSIYLGASAIDDLPLDPDSTDGAYDEWCEAVRSLTGSTCAALEITPQSPVLALDLAAVPLRSVPLRSVPLRSVPVAAPLRSVPLRSVPLRSVALGEIPLRSVDGLDVAAVEELAGLLLSELSPQSLLRTELLGADPTLADRTLAELVALDLLQGYDLADLGPFEGALEGLTIGNIADHVADSVTLGTALLSLLDAAEVPWENLRLGELDLPRYDSDGTLVRYTASFTLTGDGAARSAQASVTLPEGFEYARNVTGLPEGSRTPVQDGRTLTWQLADLTPSQATGTVSWSFDVRPPLALQQGTAELDVTVPAVVEEPGLYGSDTASVQVVSRTSTDPATAPVVAPDTLVIGHTPAAGQVGYLRVAVPEAGTRVSVFLSQHVVDNDLVAYGPADGADSSPGAAPLRSVPLRSVPLTDPGVDATGALAAPSTLQDDVPVLTDHDVVGFSTQRGTVVEQVDLLSYGGGGTWTVQVSGYNGAYSDQPWMLRVQQVTPAETVCPPRGYPSQTGGTDALPAGPDATTRSLFLVNEQQLQAEYGRERTAALLGGLGEFVGRADVAGAVVRVDDSAAVTRAYDGWNTEPCSIEAVNGVVDAVSGLVVDYARTYPGVESVTVVGGDQQVPFARVPDLTVAVNERGFAPEATGVDAAGNRFDNPFSAAAAAGFVLSDDPYGTLESLAWLDRELYVPQLAVGRLVETPEQVLGQLEQFRVAGGIVDPGRALTTGYDFLTDGAEAVDAALAGSLDAALGDGTSATRSTLISDTWTRTDLRRALGVGEGAAPAPSIASVNAHFDPNRALPADGDASGDESDLFVTSDVVGSGALRSSLLFSMGCHAGLSIPAGYSGIAGAPAAADWPKAFASEGALWVANTGYGLGDTATVALSEELMASFAARLDGTSTAGAALAWAKQDYVGSLGVYGSADEKVLQQIVFYGLPMWRIGGPTSDGTLDVPTSTPAPVQTVDPTPLAGGVATVSTTLTPKLARTDVPGLGSFWAVDGGTQTTAGLPVQPRTSVPATAGDGTDAHGVLVTGLTSRDVSGVDPAFARAVLDDSTNEPEQDFPGVAFPAGIASLNTSETPAGPQTRLVVVPGQFFSDPGRVIGTQRLFDRVEATTFYSSSDSFVPPTFRTLQTERGEQQVTFTIDVEAAAGESVDRVVVLVRDGGAAQWRPVELSRGQGTTWTATAPVGSRSIEWFAQAVSSAGNVAVSANKGALFGSSAQFAVEVVGVEGQNGFYTSEVEVVVDGPAARYTATVDGGTPQQVFGGFVLTEDGTYSVRITGSDGEVRELVLSIDRTPPVVAVVPADGRASFLLGGSGVGVLRCGDGDGSGLTVTCPTTTVTVDTALPGAFTAPLSGLGLGLAVVTDRAGNSTTVYAYQVRYVFSGFLPPVDGDAVNPAEAGSTVPVKFTLEGASGALSSRQAVDSVTSRQVPCGSGIPDGGAVETVDEPISSLKIKDGRYEYNWVTDPAWAGSCRLLEIRFADDTTASVAFRLR